MVAWARELAWWRWVMLIMVVSGAAFVLSLLVTAQSENASIAAENERILEELEDAKEQNEDVLRELDLVRAQNEELRRMVRESFEESETKQTTILQELREFDRSGSPQHPPQPEPGPMPEPSPQPQPPPVPPDPEPEPDPSPDPSPSPSPSRCILEINICEGPHPTERATEMLRVVFPISLEQEGSDE